jgi:hypothetical protein
MSLLQVGQIVPLVAILECPAGETVYVRAEIRDRLNAVLSVKNLIDQSNGEFTNYTYLMPDEPLIKVFYQVFEDAGYTTPSSIFCPDNETYTRLEIDEAQAVKIDHLVGLIRSEKLTGMITAGFTEPLKGVIDQANLFGCIGKTERLIGTIINENLKGAINGNL